MSHSSTPPSDPNQPVRLFPLTGSLLLPGTFLPLNVFESRYRQLVRHVMEDDRRIGMIQPYVPGEGAASLEVADPQNPPLYDVGCVGEVVECEPQVDGRFLIVLRGERRFRVVEELSRHAGGYRRVLADSSGFPDDADELEKTVEIGRLLTVAGRYCAARELEFDLELLAALAPAQTVNALCAALPFAAADKQALLEAAEPEARRDLLETLLEMQLRGAWEPPTPFEPPTVN